MEQPRKKTTKRKSLAAEEVTAAPSEKKRAKKAKLEKPAAMPLAVAEQKVAKLSTAPASTTAAAPLVPLCS